MGSLYGFEVKSELPLGRLNAAAGPRGELVVEAAGEQLVPPAGEPAGSLISDDGRCWFASYELEDGNCLLQMPPTGSFLLEPSSGRIVVDSPAGDAELLEHRIVSSAICTLLSMRDDLGLHAAAVEVDARAIVFCGPSLRGKSTLARALGEAGCRLLGEDGIAIELGERGPIAHPGARGVRMRSRDGDGRQRTVLLEDPGRGEAKSRPVAAVVLLGERGAEFEVEPLEPARALALLTPTLIHSGGRTAIAAAFQRLAALLGTVPALQISLPDDLDALPEACQKFLDVTRLRG
ncbi:MAG: hypothetical protein QOF13_2272 [Solirubrobacterales bacterium]|jgi:hypothetical protein|nr:hypothetical protein [Solirubrobacterales bacterium]